LEMVFHWIRKSESTTRTGENTNRANEEVIIVDEACEANETINWLYWDYLNLTNVTFHTVPYFLGNKNPTGG